MSRQPPPLASRPTPTPAASSANGNGLGWLGIVRLGLVQAGIGAVVVLATSTLSRLMTVELALPALVPGALVALHYMVQLARPRFGHGSDRNGRRGPFVIGGMAATAGGGWLAACGVALAATSLAGGLAVMTLGFVMLGIGVAACGTAQLAWLAEAVAPARRGAAAALGWFLMMIGFIVSAGVAGAALRPYSPTRLVEVAGGVGLLALVLSILAVVGLERGRSRPVAPGRAAADPARADDFLAALKAVWAEPHTRRFAGVVFLAMLAYAGQELVLESLAGAVFGYSPAASTQMMGLQRGGVLVGMAAVGLLSGLRLRYARRRAAHAGMDLSGWMGGGCAGAALALGALAVAAVRPGGFPLSPVVFALGLADGVFAVAAVGAMMGGGTGAPAAGDGSGGGRAGVRVGVWGAAQALAYALGGLIATGALQAGRAAAGAPSGGYALSFGLQAALFVLAAALCGRSASGAARGQSAAFDPNPELARTTP